ncbi:hypothetical protein GE061_006558 [Apolygus lucorum]|uniref:CRAL-TRIO domain-containing protein n=1 Tax=Apolygus lucorum TaxID=248454 RepID=A0A8S9WY52_APOLU|nr:hypothetical protein GE061_006558 [Apolygus lucorum]
MSLQPLSYEQEERILLEIGYSRLQLNQDIEQLKEWLKMQEHLPQCRLQESDIFLSNFLVGCKGSLEISKKKLDYYYTLRGKGDIFCNRDKPEFLDKCHTFAAVIQLPKNTPDDSRVYIARLIDTDLDKFNPIAYLQTLLLLFEHRFRNDGITDRETYLIDCKDLSLRHFLQFTPTLLKSYMTFFLDANPLRVKKLLIANAPTALAAALNNVFLPFLSAKLRKRYFVSDEPLEKVFEYPSMLPSDYEGGKEKSLAELNDEWYATFKKTLAGISSQLGEVVDENKRPRDGGIENPYFGLNGSIKSRAETFLPSKMSFYYPTKDEEDKILKEIGYSRSQLERDIPSLRLWLQEQIHLPESRLKENDVFLSNFLVGCKGSIEQAKRKLDHYYSMRGKGEAFMNRSTFDYVDSVEKYVTIVDLPKPTPEGNCIALTHMTNDDVEMYNGVDTLKKMLLLFELKLRTIPIAGQHIYILDAANYSMSHFLKLPPTALRSFTSFFQEAYPVRVKKILVTNVPQVLATAINTVIVPFLSKKLKDRFHVTSDPIHKAFEHVEVLPKDIEGGKGPALADLGSAWAKTLKTSQIIKDLLPQLSEEADESKRPQLKNGINDPYFGLHGSIKALVLD